MSLQERDRRLRAALEHALANDDRPEAMGAIFGALATLVESEDDAKNLQIAQAGVLALVGRFPAGSS